RLYRERIARRGDDRAALRRLSREGAMENEPIALLPPLLEGLMVTLQVTAGAIALAIPLAVLAGLGRLSRNKLLRWPASVYVEVFRGTSALVQLFWFFFVLPLLGVQLPAIFVGILVL